MTISDVCDLVTDGTHYTPKDVGAGFPFLTVKDVSASGSNFKDCSFITESDYQIAKAGNSAPIRGDILFSKDGTVGKVHVVSTHQPFAVLSSLAILRPKAGQVDPDYLGHVLRYPVVLDDALKKKTGSAIRRIVLGDLKRVRLPLPSVEEQRRIAAILTQAETLRTQRRAALAQLENLTQSIFLDMFGDPEHHQWKMQAIADIVDEENGSIRTGPFGSQLLHSEFVSEGVAVLGIDNVVTNEFRWNERRYVSLAKYQELKRYTVHPGDVLITIMGTCGRCAVVPDDLPPAVNTKHLCCISVDKQRMTPAYLHAYFLRHPIARKYLAQTAKGAIMAGLNMGIIKAMPIPVPSLALQQTFVARIQAIEALKVSYRAALAELDALFASLQQQAFNGELTRPAAFKQIASTKSRDFNQLSKLDSEKMLESLIYIAKRMPQHDVYKSLKGLYFGDKHHLANQGRLIYGETYSAMDHGPVPQAAYDLTKTLKLEASTELFVDEALLATFRLDGFSLIPIRDADFAKLSAAERESLDWAIRYVAHMTFEQVKKASHDAAYERTPHNLPIRLEHIVEMLPAAARQKFFFNAQPQK